MNIEELTDSCQNAEDDYGRNCRVAGIDTDTGETFAIKGVRPEVHTDADGSVTVWIELEKN